MAPVWREFFSSLNEQVRNAIPFSAPPIPKFRALRIPKQEIVQEGDNEG
jgi:hypothetical protein